MNQLALAHRDATDVELHFGEFDKVFLFALAANSQDHESAPYKVWSHY